MTTTTKKKKKMKSPESLDKRKQILRAGLFFYSFPPHPTSDKLSQQNFQILLQNRFFPSPADYIYPGETKIPFSYDTLVTIETSGFSLSFSTTGKTTDFIYSTKILLEGYKMKNTLVVCLVVLIAINSVTSRWLPTRSQEDRLDKLREMLKDLLESEIERSNYESKTLYKRDVASQIEAIQTGEANENANKPGYTRPINDQTVR